MGSRKLDTAGSTGSVVAWLEMKATQDVLLSPEEAYFYYFLGLLANPDVNIEQYLVKTERPTSSLDLLPKT